MLRRDLSAHLATSWSASTPTRRAPLGRALSHARDFEQAGEALGDLPVPVPGAKLGFYPGPSAAGAGADALAVAWFDGAAVRRATARTPAGPPHVSFTDRLILTVGE